MTGEARDAYAADDSILLYLVRDGDTQAFDVLRRRHEQAASRLARCLVPAEQADDVVAGAFDGVLGVTLRGGGPADAFRLYLLTAVRRVSYDRLHAQRTGVPVSPSLADDPGEPFMDPAVASLESSLVVRAFRSLPERWIAVLWHTEIEEKEPAELGDILGLAPGETATLRRRAWDGLRRAYLRMQMADGTWPECQPVVRRLAGYVEDAASSADGEMVAEHLSHCDDCRAVCAQLQGLDVALHTVVAPVFLGGAAAAYLSAEPPSASTAPAQAAAGPLAAAAAGQLAAADAAAGRPQPAGETVPTQTLPADRVGRHRVPVLARRASRRLIWVAATAVPVIAVVVVLAVTLVGGSPAPAQRHQQALAATAPATTSGNPQKKTTTHPPSPAAVSASPAPAGSPSVPPAQGSSSASRATANLSATVSVAPSRDDTNQVTWAVTNTGKAATDALTVSLSFPSGASLQGSGAFQADNEGWNCQPTAAGASCQRGALAAGSQAQGAMVISVDGPEACGQPVDMTASGGNASASAQSPEGINCGGVRH